MKNFTNFMYLFRYFLQYGERTCLYQYQSVPQPYHLLSTLVSYLTLVLLYPPSTPALSSSVLGSSNTASHHHVSESNTSTKASGMLHSRGAVSMGGFTKAAALLSLSLSFSCSFATPFVLPESPPLSIRSSIPELEYRRFYHHLTA